MARTCTVCRHPDREAIDRALLIESTPNRRVAAQYGLTEQAIRRHRRDHVSKALAKAGEAVEIVRADNLFREVRDLQARTLAILVKAEGAGDLRNALGAIREARACVALLAELALAAVDRMVEEKLRAELDGALDLLRDGLDRAAYERALRLLAGPTESGRMARSDRVELVEVVRPCGCGQCTALG